MMILNTDLATVVDEDELHSFLHAASLPLLCAEQERELAQRIAGGDQEAQEHLVRSNLRLVVSVAKHYRRQNVSLEDLVQEGILGLMRAAQKFDGRGRFSSYATFWIRQAISRGVDRLLETIHTPEYIAEQKRKLSKLVRRLADELEREPTFDEIANRFLGDKEQLLFLQELERRQILSLDMPLDDDQLTLGDMLESHPAGEEHSNQHSLLQEALASLDIREQDILSAHYGLNGRPPETFEIIASRYGLCKERIRQIEVKAIHKIRMFFVNRRQAA